MIVKKLIATVIYNVVFWGVFLISALLFNLRGWDAAAFILYPTSMPLLFQAVSIAIFPTEKKEWRMLQVNVQILTTIVFSVMVNLFIYLVYGEGGLFSGSWRFLWFFVTGLLGTISFMVFIILDAFLANRGKWQMRVLLIIALVLFFFALLLEGFRIISFLLFMLIGILQITCEDKGNR